MKSRIPYSKEIIFGSKIAEICSISLEHELKELEEAIEGNFIVSGEYKSHEISINKEPFSYKLPFSVEVTEDIIKESVEFEITDFTYEILNENTLKVDIEFLITAEEQTAKKEEEVRNAIIEEVEQILSEEPTEEQIEEIIPEKMEEQSKEEETEEIKIEEEIEEETEARLDNEKEEMIMESIPEKEEEFATYHIHIVSSTDTIESICATYQMDLNTLKEYNHLDALNEGDKIIVPCLDE